MRRHLLILTICLVALLGAGQMLSAAAPASDSAKPKKCKKKKGAAAAAAGKPKKCKKKGAKGPSAAFVEQSIAAVAKQTYAPAGGGPGDVEVVFDRKTAVGAQTTWDTDGDPTNGAAGEIKAWPVEAWVRILSHKLDGSSETYYGGCNGHLSESWPYDGLYMFYKSSTGGYEWRSETAGPGDC